MTAIIPLAELRQKIDAIDAELLRLLNERALCALDVAKTKIAQGEQGCFYRPDRESLVLRRIQQLNQGPLSATAVTLLFREVMSACLALEKPLEVAFLGPEGTFTQQAAFKHFGHAVQTIPLATISEIFNHVETGACQFGVVPVENSSEGVINHTLDNLLVSDLKICGEVEIRVHQNLIGLAENYADIDCVYSHQQSLAQCRRWLDKHLPKAERIAVNSNAEAVKLVANDKNKAAIAGIVAAELYQLPVIARNIEDIAHNTTRFIIIGRQTSASTGKDKTSLVLSTGNKPGALHSVLEPFARFGVDMMNIESRPSQQGLWDYVFFIDVQGHADDDNVAHALAALRDKVNMLKILGSYPKAVY